MSRASRHRASQQNKPPEDQSQVDERDTFARLIDARETFQTAELGLIDLLGDDPLRRKPGLSNAIVYGVATTIAIQNLRKTEPEFDGWWKPIQEEMRADPLMKFCWNLRSQILKDGTVGWIDRRCQIPDGHFLGGLNPWTQLAPPVGARGFFVGDELGGCGWEVLRPNGQIEKRYVSLPREIVGTTTFYFRENAPSMHKGQPLADNSVQAVARLYIEAVGETLEKAFDRFWPEDVPRLPPIVPARPSRPPM